MMHRPPNQSTDAIRRRATAGQWSWFALLALVVFTLPGLAQAPLSPVRLTIDGAGTQSVATAITDGSETYVSIDLLDLLGRRHHMDKREECVILEQGGGEIALARPGGKAMLPLSSLATALRLTVRPGPGICRIYTRPELAPKVEPAAQPTPQPPAKPAAQPTPQPPAKPAAQPTPQPPAKPAAQPTPQPPAKPAVQPTPQPPAKSAAQPTPQPPAKPSQPIQDAQSVEQSTMNASSPNHPLSSGTPAAVQGSSTQAGSSPVTGQSTTPPQPSATAGAAPVARPQPPAVLKVQAITFERIDDRRGRLIIAANGLPDISSDFLRSPYRLRITIGHARLDAATSPARQDNPLVSRMDVAEDRSASTIAVTLTLARMVSYQVESSGQQGLSIVLALPTATPRSIRDALIVIDPGHGGSDSTGCSDASDGSRIYEKNLTLAIARRVQQILAEAGATVIMTRSTDVAISVGDRPIIANENGADAFVSIHIDDTGEPAGKGSATGSTAYFHRNDATSRALAQSIIDRLCGYCDTHNRGARSDGTLYSIGLGVLRGSRVPATLLELGFIGNRSDREKMLTPEFQQMVAHAITDGIASFLEGALPDATVNQGVIQP